ncbi:MAG TPA: cation transporter [Candidatus Dormibacteraeota bacterium]|jgi:divalent metal cation (Fe/Co/Zn/Cd) transporter|nr:cation transporter [Candidatus Dormibacteraeota bacterium]
MSTVALRPGPVREARLAQSLTIAWMLVEGVVAVAAGIAAGSVALTAFGADSAIEVFTAAVVLRRLLDRGRMTDDDAERRASRLVGIGLYAVAAYIVLSSAWTLLTGHHPQPSTLGLALALASVAIMPVLWRWRLALSDRLHSSAMRADAACSAVCLYMAVTLLAGLALNNLLGWWWADPLAGLAMIWWIRGEAAEAMAAARGEAHCADCA